MKKMYYVKNHVIVQSERMSDKLRFLIEELEYKQCFEKITKTEYEELEKQIENYDKQLQEYEKAKNNLINVGYNFKGYWEDVQILNNFSLQRDILDMAV